MFIGIISYLPDNEFREKRKNIHQEQIKWLRELYGFDQEIHVIAQNYYENDYIDGISYFKYDIPLGSSCCRNKLLEKFYSSDEDYILMLDDDTLIYPYYHMDIMMKEFQTKPQKYLPYIDMVVANYPAYQPFKKNIYADPMNKKKYKFVPKPHIVGMALMFLKNLNKYYSKCLYFNEQMVLPPDYELTMEDTDFGIQCMINGLKCYQASCLITKSPNWSISTVYRDENERLERNKKSIEYLIQKYKSYGITRREYGRMDTKYFNNKYHRALPVLYIDREEPIEFAENEIPDNVKKQKQRRLF